MELKIHADKALNFIFRKIERMKDYRLEWLGGVVKRLFENFVDKSRDPSQTEEDSLFFIELIINSFISIFEDYKGYNCMTINLVGTSQLAKI